MPSDRTGKKILLPLDGDGPWERAQGSMSTTVAGLAMMMAWETLDEQWRRPLEVAARRWANTADEIQWPECEKLIEEYRAKLKEQARLAILGAKKPRRK